MSFFMEDIKNLLNHFNKKRTIQQTNIIFTSKDYQNITLEMISSGTDGLILLYTTRLVISYNCIHNPGKTTRNLPKLIEQFERDNGQQSNVFLSLAQKPDYEITITIIINSYILVK